jgi:glycosyltransferase involved in cell wall biosynthesis
MSVVVATYRRPRELAELLGRLESHATAVTFEVIVVDDGADPSAWEGLASRVASSRMALAAVRRHRSGGPAVARNDGARLARGRILAFTDDDCLPDAGWLDALHRAVGDAEVVQGRTVPPAADVSRGAWDHTIEVQTATPLFETCNLAVAAEWFRRVGGFDDHAVLHAGSGRHFGEDAILGAALLEAGARRGFAPDAVVRHRWIRSSYGDHLRRRRKLEGFPTLAARSAEVRRSLVLGVFLSRRTAAFDAACAATVVGLTLRGRRRWPLLAWVPWLALALPEARQRGRGARVPVRLGQVAVADGVGLLSLLVGSLRSRRVVI